MNSGSSKAVVVVVVVKVLVEVVYIYRVSREECKNFGRVFLMLKYTDITQNTYIQS
jgi:hypothetical protein